MNMQLSTECEQGGSLSSVPLPLLGPLHSATIEPSLSFSNSVAICSVESKKNTLSGNANDYQILKNLLHLVKIGQTNEIKSIIKKSNPLDLVDSYGTTLLHFAAIHENLELIEFLLTSGFDIDCKNHAGVTSLLMSLLHKSYNASTYLLDAGADIFDIDNSIESPLKLILKAGRSVPLHVFSSMRIRLRKSMDSTKKIADVIAEVDGKIESVILLNDLELLMRLLKQKSFEDRIDNEGHIGLAVKLGLADVVGVLVQRRNKSLRSKKTLMKKLRKMMTSLSDNLNVVKPIVEQLINWNVIDEFAIRPLQRIFHRGSQEAVQMMIDHSVDLQVKKFFKRDFLWHIFHNPNLDILKLIDKNQWHVNRQDENGHTLLHHAVMCKPINVLRKLLNLGANPNIRNKHGASPLLFVKNRDCLELLLESGADVMTYDFEMNTMITVTKCERKMLQIVIAYMASVGFPKVDDIDEDYKIFLMYRRSWTDLMWMKNQAVFKDNTLYSLFRATYTELTSYPSECRDVVFHALERLRGYEESNPYFIEKIEKQLSRISDYHDAKFKIATAVAECLGVFDPKHLAVEKIVRFLTHEDIFTLL